jgi:drug/metabolite transporter (DMT)-like permease
MVGRHLSARVTQIAPHTRAYAGLCVASLAWASAFILGKFVLAELGALTAAAWRHALAALILLPFAWRGRRHADWRAAIVPLALMVVCGGVLYPSVFFAALARTSATNTSLLIALNPALTFLLSPLVGESYTRRGLLGIVLALTGAALVITHGDLSVLTNLTSGRVGDLLAFGAAGLWATFNIGSRRVVAHLPNALTNTVVYGLGCAALFALAAPQHPLAQMAAASPTAIAALCGMVMLSSVLAGQLFLYGVRAVGVNRTVVFVYIVPVLTAAGSAMVLGEALLPAQFIGGAAVLAGVWVTTRTPRAPTVVIAPRSSVSTPDERAA